MSSGPIIHKKIHFHNGTDGSGQIKHNIRAGRDTDTTSLVTDDIVIFSQTAARYYQLQTTQNTLGRRITIKDGSGNASSYNITLQTEGAEKIDSMDTFVITNDSESVTIVFDGTNWWVI